MGMLLMIGITEGPIMSENTRATALNIFVIFGAAVWPGGVPSLAMQRRVRAALNASSGCDRRLFIPSGGIGKFPPAEAILMQSLLAQEGVLPEEILVESEARDTLETIYKTETLFQSVNPEYVIWVSTDRYHLRRCLWLYRLTGVQARPCPIADGRAETKLSKWIYFCAKEYPALVWDTLLVLVCKPSPANRGQI